MCNLRSISVIIPAYNAENTILDAVKSIQSQSYKAQYEIIVVDDGSTDRTLDVITKYSKQHTSLKIKIISQSNSGVSAARKTGIRNASGDWIAFLDSDDEWLPEKIERQMNCVEQIGNIDFIGGEKVGHQTRILWKKKKGLSKIILKEQFISWYPPTPTFLFRKDIIKSVGYMDETLRYGEDDEFLLRILKSTTGWFLAEPLVICDKGNPGFGYSGLSKNLKLMQNGQREVIKRAKQYHILNSVEYLLARFYSEIKYYRRIIKTMIRR